MRELIGLIIFLAALALLHPKVGEFLESLDRITIRPNLGSFDDDES